MVRAGVISHLSAVPAGSKNDVDPATVFELFPGSDSDIQALLNSETLVFGVFPSLSTIVKVAGIPDSKSVVNNET